MNINDTYSDKEVEQLLGISQRKAKRAEESLRKAMTELSDAFASGIFVDLTLGKVELLSEYNLELSDAIFNLTQAISAVEQCNKRLGKGGGNWSSFGAINQYEN